MHVLCSCKLQKVGALIASGACVCADPVSRGKDMANITGMKEVLEAEQKAVEEEDVGEEVVEEEEGGPDGRPPPVVPRSRTRKRGRRLTQLESDEEQDDSEEYKATESVQ